MAARQPSVSYAAYAQAEAASELKHEWHDGLIVAMAGGTLRHAALAARVIESLGVALRGKPCQVFSADARVRIKATKLGTYPDAAVACGALEVDDEDPHSLLNPRLLVEVLSESTEAYDRGGKFAHYRAIPSLMGVLFVRQDPLGVELYARRADGVWELTEAATGELAIGPLEITLDVDALFRAPLPD